MMEKSMSTFSESSQPSRNAQKTSQKEFQEACDALSSFNTMQSVLSSINYGVLLLNSNGDTTFANPYILRLTGFTEQDLLGHSTHKLFHPLPQDNTCQQTDCCPIYSLTRTSKTHQDYKTSVSRKDGTRFPIELSSSLIKGTGLLSQSYLLTFRDISYQEELQKTALELTRVKAEVEHFSYLASHDFQEPLRMVSSFLQLLERRYKDQFDDKAKTFIQFAIDGSNRMRELIEDLAAYSRISSIPTLLESVDCDVLMKDLISAKSFSIKKLNGRVSHDPLPTVKAEAKLLETLFHHLLDNALKFRRDVPPTIHVTAQQTDHEWVFSITDNGIGIDPQFVGKIFGIFKRYNKRSEYQGTGIGLATCKKIVERYGGQIWVEPSSGEGATFSFSLPTTSK